MLDMDGCVTINYTFKMQQTFPNKVVELFMSDVDGYAETVVILAYTSKTNQC